ncbi:hypothetical protein PISMIDRAFT_18483 [Pisolithus microcarpus 441]|uniref:Uncharacterized protein n=1 Tax=Pisolithus microcarpus 441 TaxID=765257 RepID=A0A0C9YQY7_9AGAM|nr:hypothetical protein PISMIDRAFT_18483 [Pisolithus microcarpus 441]
MPDPPTSGHLVPASPNYLNYVWMLVIYDRRNPFDRKSEEQNDCIQVLSEIYRGTDMTLDRVPEILDQSHSLTPEVIAESIDRVLTDLTINVSALQYRLVLELTLIISPKECHSFHNREVERYTEAKVQDRVSEDTAATAGLTVAENCPDVEAKEAEPDPWSQEPLEFSTDNRYSKRRDASYSKTAKFLSETTSYSASAFAWRSFLDTATWSRTDHHLHNAINTTMPLPAAAFHPIDVPWFPSTIHSTSTPATTAVTSATGHATMDMAQGGLLPTYPPPSRTRDHAPWAPICFALLATTP